MSEVLKTELSDMQLRAKLEEMVINDLLGPAGGPNEEVDESNVHDRYLVGVLGPVKRADGETTTTGSDEEGDDAEVPLIPDELSEGGSDTLEDGKTDQDVAVVRSRFPSSFGMTFGVDGKAKALRIDASWGQYIRAESEELTDKNGKPKRIWKRHPRGGSAEIPLKDGPVSVTSLNPEVPNVVIQGQVRKRQGHFIVTLFLVNRQEDRKPRSQYHVFQPTLTVASPDGAAIFKKKLERPDAGQTTNLEEDTMAMLYRHEVEFAVGHGVSVHAEVSEKSPNRATVVRTQVVPQYEVPRTTPPTADDAERHPAFAKLDGLVLDMRELADSSASEIQAKLKPLISAYEEWIEVETAKIDDPGEGLADYQDTARTAMANCRKTLERIEEGLALIQKDEQAEEAFRFMNRAMWLQRTHSIYSEEIRRGGDPDFDTDIDVLENRRWYPFQIAFVLLNLPGVTKLNHPDRSESQEALADLLFFPTGGGKTEAYLGLSAYTMGLRRLQGTVAGRSGENGVAVLMRYTLRLLTIQQFQRATALLCACEDIRRKALERGDDRWGRTPFRIGLWVGRRTTPNRTDDAAEAIKQARGNEYSMVTSGIGTPYQLTHCPWCGSEIKPGRHLDAKPYKQGACRTLTHCGDKFGQCLFSKRQAPEEGLPIVVVDEEIYRRLPTLLIATVDKFAQMPWKGEVQMLFGQVNGYCERHGFRSPEIEDTDSHPKTRTGLPPARTIDQNPLRPPDLIIQDELHLISGPLGTLVGLYETAIDNLCTWEVDGKKVRPKLLASTATIRNADVQVHKLFLRKVNVFPPHGLSVRDNFFSLQRKPSAEHPGRLYLGR